MKAFRKGIQSQADIAQWLRDLRPNASTPESGFHVSVVFRAKVAGQEDYYFGGVNVESVDHRITTHGEEGAIAGMLTALGKNAEIAEGWVMGGLRDQKDGGPITCCGKCRQQIAGIAGPDVKIHYFGMDGKGPVTTVGAFLPGVFTFRSFISIDPAAAPARAPSAAEVERRLVRAAPLAESEIKAWLAGLESIDHVTKVTQSAVLRLGNDFYVAGVKMEEAAFQSMNAAQSAVAVATSEFGPQKIEEVFVYTKGRDEKALPPGAYGTLPLSALQTVFEYAANEKIPVHFFNDSDKTLTLDLQKAATVAPKAGKPYYKP